MVKKIWLGGEWTAKKWITAIILGTLIVVFAVIGFRPNMGGDDSSGGGVAATVNDHYISMADFRRAAEQAEQNARMRYANLPEAQRRAMTNRDLRQQLENLIANEVIYQAAVKKGVVASDGEVKSEILELPYMQENGRFTGERYRLVLQNVGMTPADFERQVRQDIVHRKVLELFVGSAAPTREELKRNRMLSNHKVNLRFSEISRDDLTKFGLTNANDVQDFQSKHKAEIEAYYKDNIVEFTDPERYHARDIVIRVDEKRPDAEAKKLAAEVRAQVTPQNFSKLAAKYSEDPGAKSKGGDLGERLRGTLQPAFEEVALNVKPGTISAPIKLEGGYHVIYMESLKPGGKKPLDQVESQVAAKLVARLREPEIVAKLRETVEKGDKKEVDALLAKAKMKWQESGEFDLSSPVVPKLGDAKDVIPSVLKVGRKGGLVHQLIPFQGNFLVVDVLGWREVADTNPEVDGLDRMVAYRKAEGPYDAWIRDAELQSSIQRNPRLAQ